MPDEFRLPIVLAIAAMAGLAIYAYRNRTQRLQLKSDNQRRARRDHARLIADPQVEVPDVKRKAQGFGRR